MARLKYREHLQMVHAVQWKGNNLAELEEFAPGQIVLLPENIVRLLPPPYPVTHINIGEWLMDDPYVGHLSVITDAAFQQRFDPSPVP